MARRPTSAAASRIRIEDEVWEEAFSSRVSTRRRRTETAHLPVRAARPSRAVPEGVQIVRPVEELLGERPPAAIRTPQESASYPRVRVEAPRLRAAESFSGDPYAVPPPAGRRTIRIQGRGAEVHSISPSPNQNASTFRPRSLGANPDRLAMWATLLGFLLVAVALLSSRF